MKVSFKKFGVVFSVLIFSLSCSKGKDTATTDAAAVTDVTSSVISSDGTLRPAFSGALAGIGLEMTSSSDLTSLALTDDNSDKIKEVKKPYAPDEKEKIIDEILNAESIDKCFEMANLSWSQPECFSPNISDSNISEAASSDNPFVLSFESGITEALFGDTGIAKAKSTDGSSCAASSIIYFTEDPLAYLFKAEQIFASLVCVSKFVKDLDLPAAGETKDYLSAITDNKDSIKLPDDISFKKASISSDENSTEDDPIYTTELSVSMKTPDGTDSVFYTIFKVRKKDNSGHVITFQTNVSNALNDQNAKIDPPPQDPPPPPADDNNPSRLTDVVSVIFNLPENEVGKVEVYKGGFNGDKDHNPAKYIDSNGAFDFDKIAEWGTDNTTLNNTVYTIFELAGKSESSVLNKGLTYWTASLSDRFWRMFAYIVNKETDGTEKLQSTFGFTPSYNSSTQKYSVSSKAPLGMFCAWAKQPDQITGSGSSSPYLQTDGFDLPNAAYNGVQYAVATKSATDKYFMHDSENSGLSYVIGNQDCGSGSNKTIKDIDSNGNISGVFTVPEITAVTPLGISLDPTNIDLGYTE